MQTINIILNPLILISIVNLTIYKIEGRKIKDIFNSIVYDNPALSVLLMAR